LRNSLASLSDEARLLIGKPAEPKKNNYSIECRILPKTGGAKAAKTSFAWKKKRGGNTKPDAVKHSGGEGRMFKEKGVPGKKP